MAEMADKNAIAKSLLDTAIRIYTLHIYICTNAFIHAHIHNIHKYTEVARWSQKRANW